MSDYELDTNGDITGKILTDDIDISLQRVIHILRSFEGDHPLTTAYGNPSGISDKFNVQLFLNNFQLELDNMIESDDVVAGLFSVKLVYDDETKYITINIINNTTKEKVNTFNMDYYGKLNKPDILNNANTHTPINILTPVNDDGYIYIDNCSFINKKLVYVGLNKPQFKTVQFQINLQKTTSIINLLANEIKRYSFYIDRVECEQFPLTLNITSTDLTATTDSYSEDVIISIVYCERNSNLEPTFTNYISTKTRPIIKNINKFSTKLYIPNIDYTKKYYVISGIDNNVN